MEACSEVTKVKRKIRFHAGGADDVMFDMGLECPGKPCAPSLR
jgi:hypothetical protein